MDYRMHEGIPYIGIILTKYDIYNQDKDSLQLSSSLFETTMRRYI